MKPLFVLIFLSSLLLSVNLSYGRKEAAAEDYWKNVMKKQPIPKALVDLVQQESATATKTKRFVKDFDVSHNAILYHTNSHDEPKKESSIKPDHN